MQLANQTYPFLVCSKYLINIHVTVGWVQIHSRKSGLSVKIRTYIDHKYFIHIYDIVGGARARYTLIYQTIFSVILVLSNNYL